MKKILAAFDPVSKVVLSYLLMASAWICFSDQLVDVLAAQKGLITTFQTYKGLFFVSSTTVLLYILVNRITSDLKQSRDQFQHIMDQSPAVICTLDGYGRFKQINSVAQEIWGYPTKDLVGKKFLNFLHPDDAAANAKLFDKILTGTDERDFENRYIKPDGSVVWMKWNGRWNAIDNVIYCIGINVTPLKEAKEKVLKERNLLRAIIDNIPDYIFAKDRDRRLVRSNKALNRVIFGEKFEEKGLGKTAFDVFKPEIAKSMDNDDKRVIENGELIINREEKAHDANGKELWLQTTKVPLRNQNNEIEGLVGITRNITRKKKIENQIKQAKERYELVIKATQDIVFDWDITSNRFSLAKNFEDTFGINRDHEPYTLEQLVEKMYPDDRQRIYENLMRILDSPAESQFQEECRLKKTDGTYANILKKGFIIRDENGKAIRMIGTLKDITELKQKEHELTESLKEKQILLSEVHHRVKNNLAIVSGMMQLQAFDEKRNEVKSRLMDSVTRIQSMAYIHEHLYQSESFADLDFSANLKKLIKSITTTIPTKTDITLEFNVVPVQLNVNQAMPASLIVNEVITNILKHAFKNMDKGKIVSTLVQVDKGIKLKISHNGVGMPEKLRKEKMLGLQIISELSNQLSAYYNYKSSAGDSVFSLEFEKSDYKGIGNASL